METYSDSNIFVTGNTIIDALLMVKKKIDSNKQLYKSLVKMFPFVDNDKKVAKIFLKNVKSSIAIHNSSTPFADGGEFGFGGEVGISTNNLPPRGPVGLEKLVTYKYEINGKGQIRK